LRVLIKTLVKRYNRCWKIKYYDEDKDLVTIGSDLELKEALQISSNNFLRIHLFEVKKPNPQIVQEESPILKFTHVVDEFFADLVKSQPVEVLQHMFQTLFNDKHMAKTPTPPAVHTPVETPLEPFVEIPVEIPVEKSVEKSVPITPEPSPACARFLEDITIPRGFHLKTHQKFVKTWRFRNEGAAAWPEGTQLIFIGGDKLSEDDFVDVPALKPFEEVNLSVNMTCPKIAGKYVGYWRLTQPNGTRFGQRIWCEIVVDEPHYSVEVHQLLDMGFEDPANLEILLIAHNNNVGQVLQFLLQ